MDTTTHNVTRLTQRTHTFIHGGNRYYTITVNGIDKDGNRFSHTMFSEYPLKILEVSN